MLQHQRCVVLNNLYQEKIQQAAAAYLENPAVISVFQPYTARHLCAVRDCVTQEDQPIPVFLIAGNYGEVASGVGLLTKVEYSDEMPEGRKEEISKHILDSEGLFALNVLTITNVSALRQPIPLSLFVKVSNEEPLSPGQWTASVCYFPDLVALIAAI
jgi:hypothetical protein